MSLYQYYHIDEPLSDIEEVKTKVCKICKCEKPLSDFPGHFGRKDGLDSRCKECKSRNSKLVEQLRKSAPPKPKVCDLCGQVPEKMVLDHDPETKLFRGWICDRPCNLALGWVGDTPDMLRRALNYVERYRNVRPV
jgi:hypothetical protein